MYVHIFVYIYIYIYIYTYKKFENGSFVDDLPLQHCSA